MRPETGILSTQGPVARIRTHAGDVCGTGLLVGERHVVTCAHVVDDALPDRRRGETAVPGGTERVSLDLPFLDRRGLSARVVAWHPMVDDVEGNPVSDISVLELEESVSGGLDPREAVLSAPPAGTAFTTLGFPSGMDGGAEAQGELRMRDAGGWRHVQDTQNHGYFVEPGFSGAPVFDAEAVRHGTRRLLGMVVAADRDADKRLAFVIPTPTLGHGWPLLVRPYKGLDAFEAEDADLFFGRGEKVAELAEKIARRPFVALIGPSGSGKSSLVRAGLVPRLRGRGGWATATFMPRSNPLYELAEALVSLTSGRLGDGLAKRAKDLEKELQADPRHVLDYVPTALDAIPGAARLLLIVDQFEELFTLVDKPGAIEDPATPHGAFAAVLDLIGARSADEGPIRVVGTLRADFTGHALRHAVFERLMTDADVLLGPMSPADLTDAVAKPAERFDVTFDPGLVSEIVAAMRDSRGGLPLMQFALDRLWQVQTQRRLTQASYAAIGGVEGALNDHAEAFRKDLGPEDQATLRRVMTRLVNLADPSTGSEDTRAVATRAEIGENDWALVSKLAKARLVAAGGAGGQSGSESAEIAHEALIRAWDTLRDWLDEDRNFALWRQRLRHDVERWGGSNDDALLRGALLADAEAWQEERADDLNEAERTYIEAGIARREVELEVENERQRVEAEKEKSQREDRLRMLEDRNRQQKRFVRRLGVLAVALIAALFGAGVLAWRAETLRAEAEISQADAELAARESLGRRLAAEARLTMSEVGSAEAAERAAALAIEAWRYRPTSQAYQVAVQAMREVPIFRIRYGSGISTLGFSPDGSRVAISNDGAANILDSETGEEIARIEHGSGFVTLAFSPEGTRLAIGDEGGIARILDAETGEEIAHFEHSGWVYTFAFSPNGSRLAVGSNDGTARILDADSGEEIARIAHGDAVTALAWSPSGNRLATGSNDNTARIFDMNANDTIKNIAHRGWVRAVDWSPDGKWLATGSNGPSSVLGNASGFARIFEMDGTSEIANIKHNGDVRIVKWSPDGSQLATGSEDMTVRIFNPGRGSEVTLIEHDGIVEALAWNSSGTRLATGSNGGNVFISNLKKSTEAIRIKHDGPINILNWNSTDSLLLTGSGNGVVRTFDPASFGELTRIQLNSRVQNLTWPPGNAQIATSSTNGAGIFDSDTGSKIMYFMNDRATEGLEVVAPVWNQDISRFAIAQNNSAFILDSNSGDEIARIERDGDVSRVALSPNGKRLVAGGYDGAIKVMDTSSATITRYELHGNRPEALAWNPNGTRLAIGDDYGTVYMLAADLGSMNQLFRYSNSIKSLFFSPDGRRLAAITYEGTVGILGIETGREFARTELNVGVSTVAFNSDGTRLAIGSRDGIARIIDADTGEEIMRAEHGAPVWALAFSPDSMRLATGSGDGSARILDAEAGEEIARVKHGGPVYTVAFSPDSDLLATGSADGTVRIFDAEPSRLFERLCTERAGRNLTRSEWRRYIGEDEPWRETCPDWRTVEEISAEGQTILSTQ